MDTRVEAPVYLDYAASAPPYPEALDTYLHVAREFHGNPSAHHDAGFAARHKLEETREQFASLCGFTTGRLVLTSGATEANNTVIRGIMDASPDGHLALAADVHDSAWFARELYPHRTDVIPLDKRGRITMDALAHAVTERTVLCSMLHGNNETGLVHDIDLVGFFCSSRGILFHCDGVQTLGRLPLALGRVPFDFYTFSAHKFGGPRGVGGILARSTDIPPLLRGGAHELNLRAGTENVAGFAAAARALELTLAARAEEAPRLKRLARLLAAGVMDSRPGILLNSDLDNGLPGLVSLSFPGLSGPEIATELNLLGFQAGTGSACHADDHAPSRVIRAIGRREDEALGTVRISMGRLTTHAHVERLVSVIDQVIRRQPSAA